MPVPFEELSSAREGERSEDIKKRVVSARLIQEERFRSEPAVHCNAQMSSRLLKLHASLDEEGMSTLREAMKRLDMSARAYDRILKVARTIADLDGFNPADRKILAETASKPVAVHHIREALSYRNLDRGNWGQTVAKLPF